MVISRRLQAELAKHIDMCNCKAFEMSMVDGCARLTQQSCHTLHRLVAAQRADRPNAASVEWLQ